MRALRGAHILVAFATLGVGPELCETLIALGAEVIAADTLRTRLIDLRAQISKAAPNQHERFHVAEVDLSNPLGILTLISDARRPLDAFVSLSDEATVIQLDREWIVGDTVGSILIQLDTQLTSEEIN